jgi:glucoamylase
MLGRLAATALVLAVSAAAPAGAADTAPGAPGAIANWTEGDKDGFGGATSLRSKVWFTLDDGELTEVYFPDLGTPSVRDLQFVVSDGRTFTEREREDAGHEVRLVDRRSLTYRQVNTAHSGRWRITKTYVADPARSAVLVDVRFESLTGRPYRLYALYDPALSNGGDDDSGISDRGALVAFDERAATALAAAPALGRTSSGFKGTSDGWIDLKDDHRMDWSYRSAPNGNVVQTGRTSLTGLRGGRRLRLALGFGGSAGAASEVARRSLRAAFEQAARSYAAGWHDYLGELDRPRSVKGLETTYDVSLMVLAATEDKTYRGGSIASPSMAWVWGNLQNYSGPYHLVWSRDLYHAATALLAAGDRAAAERALDYLWERQQEPDGCFPQNSNLDGTPHWPNLQLDEVAYPVVMSWQLRRFDARTWSHVERAIGCILANGPASQERWENAEGHSPATIAAEIAALVSAADIARRNGDAAAAARYLETADTWQASLERWTVTTNGPLADHPYYLRLSVDGDANAGTTYTIADGGPTVDQRTVVDPSFLELVRFGVKPADDPNVVRTLPVVDRELGLWTPNGQFWHRYNHDGYGETASGGPFPGTPDDPSMGRLWPIFAGERGEYELAAGRPARHRLAAMAATASEGYMFPEQVWDDRPPFGPPGEGTLSSTPLAWTHAQFVRLAWSIDAGRPVERPSIVACRYAKECR